MQLFPLAFFTFHPLPKFSHILIFSPCTMAFLAPYLELMRFSNPIGALMVYFPYLHGSLAALFISDASGGSKLEGFWSTNLSLFSAAIIGHSMACSWNDIVDSEIDKKVARTRSRPIPRGAISLRTALFFTFAECIIWLALCLSTCLQTLIWCLPLLPMSIIYPFSKRFTHYTTIFLSPIIAWAVYVGFVSMRVDPFASKATFWGLTCIFLAEAIHHNVLEMIYAHQDLKDDLKVGLGSMAVRFRFGPKRALAMFALLELAFRVTTGVLIGFEGVYYALACVDTAAAKVWMLIDVDLANSGSCWWWFQGGGLMGASFSRWHF
jgi:4-hydroxybenzoate polyprenyltransferase